MRKVSLYVTIIMISLFISSLMAGATVQRVCAQVAEPHNPDAMWIEPQSIDFDTDNASIGTMFNVTLALNFTEDVFAWQAVLHFNSTQLNCTRIGVTAPPTSDFMTGHSTTVAKGINPAAYPPIGDLKSIVCSEVCFAPDNVTGPHSGTLFWAEFQIILAPNAGQTLNSTFDAPRALTDTYVWDNAANSYAFTPYVSFTYSFTPEFGPLMIAIFMISTLAAVILSKNRISKKTRIDSN